MDTLKWNIVCGPSDQYYIDELGIHLDIGQVTVFTQKKC